MSEVGERYKLAESLTLNGYAKRTDSLGRSQTWKIKAIEEDRKIGNTNSTIFQEFVKEVDERVTHLLMAKELIQEFCRKLCKA